MSVELDRGSSRKKVNALRECVLFFFAGAEDGPAVSVQPALNECKRVLTRGKREAKSG